MFGICAIYTIITITVSIVAFSCCVSSIVGGTNFPVFGLAAAIFCLLGANADYPEIHMAVHFILVRKYIFLFMSLFSLIFLIVVHIHYF